MKRKLVVFSLFLGLVSMLGACSSPETPTDDAGTTGNIENPEGTQEAGTTTAPDTSYNEQPSGVSDPTSAIDSETTEPSAEVEGTSEIGQTDEAESSTTLPTEAEAESATPETEESPSN